MMQLEKKLVPSFFCPSPFFFDTRLQHLRVAHPKLPCGPCGGIVLYEDALPQHYSESSNHPSCLRCNKGFKDDSAYSEVSSPFIVRIVSPFASGITNLNY